MDMQPKLILVQKSSVTESVGVLTIASVLGAKDFSRLNTVLVKGRRRGIRKDRSHVNSCLVNGPPRIIT
jgi:hypothetical protein